MLHVAPLGPVVHLFKRFLRHPQLALVAECEAHLFQLLRQ